MEKQRDTPNGHDPSPDGDSFDDLLARWSDGDATALDELFNRFFPELHHLAHCLLRSERTNPWQTTELVSELYLKLRDIVPDGFARKGAFFGLYARKARQLLVDEARARKAKKRGGEFNLVTLEDRHARNRPLSIDLLALDEVLDRLEKVDRRMAEVANRKIFIRMREREIAEDLEVSRATVQRDWAFARRWIVRELS